MNKRLLIIFTFFVVTYLINPGHSASATKGDINNNLKEYLSAYDITFLITADLNNDGKEEKVTIYRQWDEENPDHSDDQWHILCIFDDKGNVLHMTDISYFQEVISFAVKDNNKDGLKEVIIKLEETQCWDAKTQVYGWEKGSYGFVGEFENIDNRR